MNINKSSWHYRLLNTLDFISTWHKESLCPYFWKVVATITIGPILVAIALFIVTIPFWWSVTDFPLVVVTVIGVAEIALLFSFLIITVRDRYDEEVIAGTREAPPPPPSVPNQPSLFRLWLKARHRQVCPLIDFVDDDS